MSHPTIEEILGEVPLSRFEGLKDSLVTWALLAESYQSLDILAYITSKETLDYDQFQQALLSGKDIDFRVDWAYRLAKVAALLPHAPNGLEFAEALFTACMEDLTAGKGKSAHLKLLAELRMSLGDYAGALQLIDSTRIKDIYHGYLRADCINPFIVEDKDINAWLDAFNRPLKELGMSSVKLSEEHTNRAFSRLRGRKLKHYDGGPLVSVILTVFNPCAEDLLTSVRSITNQTWTNLEILVINDASTEIEEGLLDRVANLDSRIRVINLPRNGGTYVARNFGVLAARGKYITGQDADDWSHPERIYRQIKAFEANPDSIGVDTRANRMTDELKRSALGQNPDRRCEVSLLFRRRDAVAIGGYLPIRKGADSEFRLRLEKWAGRKVESLNLPLYFTRLSSGSLSRSDFRTGWSHQARRSFYSAFSHWLEGCSHEELPIKALEGTVDFPFSDLPERLSGCPEDRRSNRICILSDWREVPPLVTELLKQARPRAVSILHLDSPYVVAKEPRKIAPGIQALLNCGHINRVYCDEENAFDELIVLDPELAQFSVGSLQKTQPSVIQIVELNASPAGYDRQIVDSNLTNIFKITPRWSNKLQLPTSEGDSRSHSY